MKIKYIIEILDRIAAEQFTDTEYGRQRIEALNKAAKILTALSCEIDYYSKDIMYNQKVLTMLWSISEGVKR